MHGRSHFLALLLLVPLTACSSEGERRGTGDFGDGDEGTDEGTGDGGLDSDADTEIDAGTDAEPGPGDDSGTSPGDGSTGGDASLDASSDADDGGFDADLPDADLGASDGGTDGAAVCEEVTVQPNGTLTAGSASTLTFSTSPQLPASFSVAQGTLPPGTALSASGALTGTPNKTGTYSFDVGVAWSGCTAMESATLNVGCPSQSVQPQTLEPWEVGQASQFDFSHQGAVGSSAYSLSAGTWPAGVTMNAAGHVTVGASVAMGHGSVTLKALDQAGCSASRTYDYRMCDRQNWPLSSAWTATNYYAGATVGGDGWINGNNIYRDREKAARFRMAPAGSIDHVSIRFGRAASTSPNLVVPVRIYSAGPTAPMAVLATTNLSMATIIADVESGRDTEVTFSPAVAVPASGSFYVAVDVSNLRWDATNKDVLSIVSNTNGQTSPSEIWERQSDNRWYRYGSPASWNLDASLYILPRVCN